MSNSRLLVALVAVCGAAYVTAAGADGDIGTKFSYRDSIANTRHNLTQRQPDGGGPNGAMMDPYRNNYNQVCVYCHTPHGANSNVKAPLWNHTIKPTTYQTYDQLGTSTLTEQVSQPGPNSLTCLSCHDGQVAVDSVINMPGSGRYDPNQATSQNDTFLNTWPTHSSVHGGLNPGQCLACHSKDAGFAGAGAPDFTVAYIGTDLRNDHPVGVTFPQPVTGKDFNDPNEKLTGIAFFDKNGNGRADGNEIRLYDTGSGYKVECASCHDPHGVPSAGPGSVFLPTFLRVSNANSGLCLTCHAK